MATQRISDPYATLEVARGATKDQVREAYRRLAKRHHPDLHADAGAAERMRGINEAWEILSNPTRRAQYEAGFGTAATATAAYPGHWASAPRRAPSTPFASRRAYGGAAYADSYADMRPEPEPSPLRWGLALLLVPVLVLSAAILGAGLLPFPLLGLLLVVFAGRLLGRDD